MKKLLLVLAIPLLLGASCTLSIDNNQLAKNNGQENVIGKVGGVYGNRMPGPVSGPELSGSVKSSSSGRPGLTVGSLEGVSSRVFETTIHFTKPSNNYDNSLLVKKIATDKGGNFKLNLEPGNYSIFFEDNFSWTSGKRDGEAQIICVGGFGSIVEGGDIVCSPFTVTEGDKVLLGINVNHSAE